MTTHVISRFFESIIVVFLVSVIIFSIMHVAPGDPVEILLGQHDVTPERMEAIRDKWGLNKPLVIQYGIWVSNALRGDFGTSVAYGVPVSGLILQRIPNTVVLNLFAIVLTVTIAIPVGVISAIKQYSIIDYVGSTAAVLGMSMPNFWVAVMLLIVFSLWLKWLPTFGISSWRSFILPSISIALMNAAVVSRFTRSKFLEEVHKDYVNTARSKGVSERTVIYKHVFRNAASSIVTLVGYRIAYILSGTIVVEIVFAWPGLGRLLINAIFSRDYSVVQGITFISAIIIVIGNFLTDISYGIIDPRIRYE